MAIFNEGYQPNLQCFNGNHRLGESHDASIILETGVWDEGLAHSLN